MKLSSVSVTCEFASPLGGMMLAAAHDRLVGVWFTDQAHQPDLTAMFQNAQHPVLYPVLQQTCDQLDQYFACKRTQFDLPLDLNGSAFEQAVWQVLLTISYGKTTRYGDMACQMGRPTAARAVGAALGRNPVAISVPCHRV